MSKQRQKGTLFENIVKEYLNAATRFAGRLSREDFSSPLGDLRGIPATIECKAHRSLTLGEFMTQVKKSDSKTGHGMPVVVAKKMNSGVQDAYFITDLEHGALLLKAWDICKEQGLKL